MNSEKPNFLAQPAVKNIFMFRNGDPYYEGRRLVINEKRVNTFETFLKEVTGGIQAPFGAVRTIYTPKAGHRVSSLEHLQTGEQYVAAGKEKFKKLDYLHIGTKKKRMLQSNGQVKPIPQSRIIVSARFLKPIKEPCTVFILANGDVLNPAIRFLIPQRILLQYERVLEMVTEKMGMRILGGARRLYTLDGTIISEGKDLENGQFYVAVGTEKFKKLPYNELIFNKPVGLRRFVGSKAASLPPIYGSRKQNGNGTVNQRDQSKSLVSSSDSKQAGDPKITPPTQQNMASIVSEISQARLLKLRQKKSGMTMSLGGQSNDEGEQAAADNPGESNGNREAQPPEGLKDDASAEEKLVSEEAKGPAAKGSADGVTDATVKGKEDEDKVKSEKERDSPSPVPDRTEEENEEKSAAPDENEDEGKLNDEKEEAKLKNRAQLGDGEVRGDGTEKNSTTEDISMDQGEEGQEKPEDEKAGSSETKKENAEEEDKSSYQMQGETEKEESRGQGSEKVD